MASAASALTVETVFRGVVSDGGNDNTGLFGPAHGSISGDAFTVTSLTELTPASTSDNGFTFAESVGGSDSGLPLLMSAVLQINGFSYAINGAQQSYLQHQDAGSSDFVNARVAPGNPGGFEHLSLIAFGSFLSDRSLGDTFSYSPGGAIGFGELALVDNHLTFSVTSVSGDAVPEPATWALMISGFGIAGASLRRRRVMATA
jgi:hypothetical protein